MKADQLKELLFKQFEQRRDQLVEKRKRLQGQVNDLQKELDRDVGQLCEAYGPEILNGLGDFSLVPPSSRPALQQSARVHRKKRKAATRQTRSGSVAHLFVEHIPLAITSLATQKSEFRPVELYDLVKEKVKGTLAYFSKFLTDNAARFGLAIEKKQVPGIAHPVNFFQVKKRADTSPGMVKGEVWTGLIRAALEGVKDGLTFAQIWENIKVPEGKTKHTLSMALRRLRDKGEVSFKDGRYYWGLVSS